MVEIILYNRTVARSQNLRGILTYARKHGVSAVSVDKKEHGTATAMYSFANGARSEVPWESYEICVDWILSRKSWGKPSSVSHGRQYNVDYTHIAYPLL